MSLDYGTGISIVNSLQTIFASLALSPYSPADPSALFSSMNIDIRSVGKPFQFLASLITAIKTYGEQIGRPTVYNDLMSIFTGQHRLWKHCYQCDNIFYEVTVFDYIVSILERNSSS